MTMQELEEKLEDATREMTPDSFREWFERREAAGKRIGISCNTFYCPIAEYLADVVEHGVFVSDSRCWLYGGMHAFDLPRWCEWFIWNIDHIVENGQDVYAHDCCEALERKTI